MWNYSDETFLNATRGIKAMLADLWGCAQAQRRSELNEHQRANVL